MQSGLSLKSRFTGLRGEEKTVFSITGPMEILVLVLNLPGHDVLFGALILPWNQSSLVAIPLPRVQSSCLIGPKSF